MLALATVMPPKRSIVSPTASPEIVPSKADGLSRVSKPLPFVKETVCPTTEPPNSRSERSPIVNVPLLPDTLPKIMAALLGPQAPRPELLNASELTAEEEKIAEPVALIVPELLTALVLAPKKFNP